MKLFLLGVICVCVFTLVWAGEGAARTEAPNSIVGTWESSVGDVHYEFVIDETHIGFMSKKLKYTATYEGSWVLIKIELEDDGPKAPPSAKEAYLLFKFHGTDKLEVLCVGTPPGGEFFLTRKK